MLFHPVIHNFRYKASVEHDNEYHIKRKLCITGGRGQHLTRKRLKLYIVLQRNALVDIKISIIDICYANMAPIPKTLMGLYVINEKFNKNAKLKN